MHDGQTELVDRCEYIVTQRDEAYALRSKKDPRDIRILDPACGSGHFLLYAFDLLIPIYEEAYRDSETPGSEATGKALVADYPSFDALHRELPGLILANNLHGIDIDPRCAQIAQLALWMRAQRAFRDFGIGRDERPRIRRSNIVVAEPMPGERLLQQEFIGSLSKDVGELVARVFDRMRLAGEAGSLLKIEEDIQHAIRDIYGVTGELFLESDQSRWRTSEHSLRGALERYGSDAQFGISYRRRLFAEDTVRGLGLVDLLQQHYDVVLMNPPFGRVSESSREYLYRVLPVSSQDLLAAFVERFSLLLCDGGRLGAITSRLALFQDTSGGLAGGMASRINVPIRALADLGYGVLDSALVEAAAYVTERSQSTMSRLFFVADMTGTRDKEEALRNSISNNTFRDSTPFLKIPGRPIAHNAAPALLELFATLPSVTEAGYRASSGAETGDNFRYLRCFWEIPIGTISSLKIWTFIAKGGEYTPWISDVHLVMDYSLIEFARRSADIDLYGQPGITWTGRTTSNASFRVLPSGCIPTRMGQLLWKDGFPVGALATLGYLNSTPALAALEIAVGGGDASVAGSAARHFLVAHVRSMPFMANDGLTEVVGKLYATLSQERHDETSPRYAGIFLPTAPTLMRHLMRGQPKRSDASSALGFYGRALRGEYFSLPAGIRLRGIKQRSKSGMYHSSKRHRRLDPTLYRVLTRSALMQLNLLWSGIFLQGEPSTRGCQTEKRIVRHLLGHT